MIISMCVNGMMIIIQIILITLFINFVRRFFFIHAHFVFGLWAAKLAYN
jgi:hypothetical protein